METYAKTMIFAIATIEFFRFSNIMRITLPAKSIIYILLTLTTISTAILVIFKPVVKINKGLSIQTFYLSGVIGALLIIILGILNTSEIKLALLGNEFLSPLGILVLFFSMAYISIFLDYCGFFDYCAGLSVKYSGNSTKKLFFYLYFTVSILTIFTSNDIIILTVTPFIYYFSRDTGIDPIPFLIAEFFAANTWSMALLVGNPTNILIAEATKIGFFEYFQAMILPTIAAGLINLITIYLIFRKKLNHQIKPITTDPRNAIKDKNGTIIGLVTLLLCIITLSLAQYGHLKMWAVSLFFAVSLIFFIILRITHNYLLALKSGKKLKNPILVHTFKKMPWGIVPFVVSLFIIVAAAKKTGITTDIYKTLNEIIKYTGFYGVMVYGWATAIICNLLNNIPASVLFVPVLANVTEVLKKPLVYAVITGTNLGANLTPFGALAGIMWLSILKNHGFKFSFIDFIKYGSIVTFFSLTGALFVLSLVL